MHGQEGDGHGLGCVGLHFVRVVAGYGLRERKQIYKLVLKRMRNYHLDMTPHKFGFLKPPSFYAFCACVTKSLPGATVGYLNKINAKIEFYDLVNR